MSRVTRLVFVVALSSTLASQELVGESQKLVAFDVFDYLYYGSSVDVDGDRLAVGSQYQGRVYVYRRDVSQWVDDQLLVEPGTHQFGWDVALDGDRLAVASGTFTASAAGIVHLYQRTAAGWQLEDELQDPPGIGFSDGFAGNIALRGGRLVATAGAADLYGPDSGAALLYERAGTGWALTQELVPNDASAGLRFGTEVAVADDAILVSASKWAGTRGAVYVFRFDGSVWAQTARLRSPMMTPGYGFGADLAVDGDLLVVGEPGNDTYGPGAGMAWVFRDSPTGYVREARLAPPDCVAWDGLGSFVDLAADRVLVGAGWHDVAYLWEPGPSGWQNTARFLRSNVDGYAFGNALALGANQALITDYVDGSGAWQAGAAYSYELPALALGQAFCFGDGSAGACPCGNEVVAGALAGCATSSGEGAQIVPSGSTSVQADDLVFGASGLPPQAVTALFGSSASGAAWPFGDGLACSSGAVVRFELLQGWGLHWGPGLGAQFGGSPGETWQFQAFFRDVGGPCGGGTNATNAVRVTLTP